MELIPRVEMWRSLEHDDIQCNDNIHVLYLSGIGMEDSTIHIYNVRVDEVKSKLDGHQKRIIGLAFSTNLNILVSSSADAQPPAGKAPMMLLRWNAFGSLRLRCRIAPSIYFSPATLSGSQGVYPIAVVAHPLEPNQFSLGLMDGSVKVIEPNEVEGK
ncbi:WD40/YVTN repeat-like-containing domain superfamily [Sesbania bispinosa]|nr:WD40/YVTN repeat-like-containing domain superfamily [Sesbania bispinosa]